MASVPEPPVNQDSPSYGDPGFVPPWLYLSDEVLRDMSTERGFSHMDPSPREIEEELTCPEAPPCTDLLADTRGVLRDEGRWPDHLCPGLFLGRSTYEWAKANRSWRSPPYDDLRWQWPLPVGILSANARNNIFDLNSLARMPFEEHEEALWALRLKGEDGSLDLFGLRAPRGSGENVTYTPGGFKYVLRGSGEELLEDLRRARRWWDWFRGEGVVGRPTGTGTWESSIEFFIALRGAVRALRDDSKKITQDNVAAHLRQRKEPTGDDARTLRRWLNTYGFKWKDVPKIP